MPVTIKKGEFKYKDPTSGEYKGVDAISERTTAEQVAAIQAKGQETLESIPDDYTALSNEVEDLKDGITEYALAPLREAYGYVSSSDGTITRAGNMYNFSYPIQVKPGDIYEYSAYTSESTLAIAAYANADDEAAIINKSVVGSGVMSGKYTVPEGVNFIRLTSREWGTYAVFRPSIPFKSKAIVGISTYDFDDFQPSNQPYTLYVLENGYTHAPVSSDEVVGTLYVYKDDVVGYIWQIFIKNSTGVVYTRCKRAGSSTYNDWSVVVSPFDSKNPGLVYDTTIDINDLVTPGFYLTQSDNVNNPHFPPADSSVGVLLVVAHPNGIIYQIYTESYTGVVYSRIKRSAGWDEWVSSKEEIRKKEISVLFVGNSLTQDGVSYLPYVLKNYYPEVSFRFYMWYNGGRTLEDQYGYFVNDTPCDIFSVSENSVSWINYNSSKTMSSILTSYKFDVVCMQEYFNYKESYTSITDWQNCRDYIVSHYTGGNPLEFISLFHAPRRNALESVYSLEKTGNGKILQDSISQDMLPVGIAIYNALQTSIGTLGDGGDLTPGDYTHTQEGLPCLIQTYTIACWLLDKLGIPKSVYGCPLRMTTAIYNTINVPGPNLGSGVITGTDAQNLIAQEVAIRAYKEGKKFVLDNLVPQ